MNAAVNIQNNIAAIRRRIDRAAERCGRNPDKIRLVCVGKTQSVDRIRQAIDAGAEIIGENYIQEAREKTDALSHLDVQWHLIGHLQRNKAKYAVRMFELIHSVDSLRLALELNKQAKKIGKHQDILIQINISGESTKSGIKDRQAIELVRDIMQLEQLTIRGLMTMPPYYDAPEKARPFFKSLREVRHQLENLTGLALGELSMGMTGDFEVAIEEGATLVRIGTALFGARQ